MGISLLTYHFLQCFSLFVDDLLLATYTLLMFVYSAGTLLFTVGRNDEQRDIIFSVIDTKWRFAVTSLLIFITYAFIAFPGFQADTEGVGETYWIPYIILIILYAVACELLRRYSSTRWLKTICRWVIVVTGFILPLFIGFNGACIFIGKNVYNELNIAVSVLYITGPMTIALLYLYFFLNDTELLERTIRILKIISPLMMISMLALTYFIFTHDSVRYDENGYFHIVSMGYFRNLVEMPFALALVIGGISLSFIGVVTAIVNSIRYSFWFSALGFLIYITSLCTVAGLNDTSQFPNFKDPQMSLSIANSSASQTTLIILNLVTLVIVPFAACHLYKIWKRQIQKQRGK